MPPKGQGKNSAKAQKAKAKKERQLLEACMRECQEKCTEARGFLEPTGRNTEPNFTKAKAALDVAFAAYEASSLAHFMLGQWYRMQGMYAEAVESYSHALDIEPINVQALEWRGHCYQTLRDYAHAVEDNTSIIALDPENDHAYNMRGLCVLQSSVPGLRLRSADFQSCVSDFRNAVRLNEANFYAMTNLGKAYEDQGRFEEAIECYGRALDCSENYAYARLRRGCTALRMAEQSLLRRAKATLNSDDEDEAAANAAGASVHASSSRHKGAVNGAAGSSLLSSQRPASDATTLREVKAEVRQQMEEEQEAQMVARLLKLADGDFAALLDPSPEAKKLAADVTVVLNIGICALLSKNVNRAETYLKLAQEIVAKRPELVADGEAPPIEGVDTLNSVLAIRMKELHALKELSRSSA